MKRTQTLLVAMSLAIGSTSALANNWQWQLDQIKADQQRRVQCHAAEQDKHGKARTPAPELQVTEPEHKIAPSSPVK